jgi:hypothetical protein
MLGKVMGNTLWGSSCFKPKPLVCYLRPKTKNPYRAMPVGVISPDRIDQGQLAGEPHHPVITLVVNQLLVNWRTAYFRITSTEQ